MNESQKHYTEQFARHKGIDYMIPFIQDSRKTNLFYSDIKISDCLGLGEGGRLKEKGQMG